MAVIGAGYLGAFHAQKYSMIEEAELAGVADSDLNRAREAASRNKTAAFASYEGLAGGVDAVSIVTPTQSHCAIGLYFLSRGVDVLIEKPIASSVEEAELLIKEAERTGSVLQVGHLERFNAAIAAIDGRVKDPVYMECRRLSPFPGRSTDVDVVMDVMIHDIDIILNLVKSEVKSVEAVGMPVVTDMADIMNARIEFKSGCVANITASRASRDKLRTLDIYQGGTQLSIDYMGQSLKALRPVAGKDGSYPSLVEEDLSMEKKDSLLEELKSFIRCSAAKSAPVVSGADGRRALEVARMIQEASRGVF
ncbi:MAG: Gfo/Idh/MocA family oxidoreductase [Deltaproteobacteria bacterium]